MLVDEVLIGELLTVDGAATGTVATGEVTTLEHELGNHTVEGRALVTLTLLGIAKLSEVPGSLGDLLVVEVEVDAASLGGRGANRGVLDLEESGAVFRHSDG